MKTLLIALLVGAIGVWSGYTLQGHIQEEAYYAFSNPKEFCLLWTNENGMHGFQYKNKLYPLMTVRALKEIINSQIWFDKADLINEDKVNWQPYNVPLPERSAR